MSIRKFGRRGAVVASIVGALIAAAGIAFATMATVVTGGKTTGSVTYEGTSQPATTVAWSGTPMFSCTGEAEGTVTGTATISSDGQTLTLSLPSGSGVYSDDTCVLSGSVQNTGSNDADITGISFGTGSYLLITDYAAANATSAPGTIFGSGLPYDLGPGTEAYLTFKMIVSSSIPPAAGATLGLNGGLVFQTS